MIGVICEPASDTLKSHLKLDDGGLVVTTVSEKMPAAEAGIQVHDVLLQIGDAKLTDVKQLLELVADSDGEELEVWALRGGEKMSVKVTPKKSTAKAAMAYLLSGDSGDPDKHDHLIRRWSDKAGGPRWIVGPGLRLDVDAKVDVEEKIAEAREKALLHRRKHAMESEEKLERAYEKAQALRADQDLQIKRSQQHEAELQKQLKSLRKQQAELLKRLKALEENQSEE